MSVQAHARAACLTIRITRTSVTLKINSKKIKTPNQERAQTVCKKGERDGRYLHLG